jgi:hypothetical protein
MALVDRMLPRTFTPGTFHTYIEVALDHLTTWADTSDAGPFLDDTLAAIQRLQLQLSGAKGA